MPNITVAFWIGDTYTEKEYLSTEAGILLANMDMIDHVTAGHWCSVDYENKSVIVTNLSQLGVREYA